MTYHWRVATRDDLPAVYQLMLDADDVDRRGVYPTLADFEREYEDPWLKRDTDFLVALTPEGQIVAQGRVLAPNDLASHERHAYLEGEIHPAHRSPALGNELFDRLEVRGHERLAAFPANGQPLSFRTGCRDTMQHHIALYESRGYQPIRYFYRMTRDLSLPVPAGLLPEGIEVRPFMPELKLATLDVFNESFSDHWGFEPISAEEWELFFLNRSTFRPALSRIAFAGEHVVGFSMNRLEPDREAGGELMGWVGQVGVRRDWRKRGLATALLCQSFRAFQAEGLRTAGLGVDTTNPTGALAIYERLDFKPLKRFINFEKVVG